MWRALQQWAIATAKHWAWLIFTVALTITGALDAWFGWRTPTNVWFYTALASLCVGQFLAFSDELSRRQALQEQFEALRLELDSIRAARPVIQCIEPRGAELHRGESSFYVVQARFLNVPSSRTEQTTARNVSAGVEFWDPSRTEKRLEIYGQWVSHSSAPDHVGSLDTDPQIDIEANDIPVKLYIALRPPDTPESYAYCNENFHAYLNGKHPAYALPFGTYHVRVRLRGPTVEQDFWFKLSNPGNGKPLGLEPLP